MKLVVSPSIETKLEEKHGVKLHEVCECFSNVEGPFLKDTRENWRVSRKLCKPLKVSAKHSLNPRGQRPAVHNSCYRHPDVPGADIAHRFDSNRHVEFTSLL